MGVHRSARPSSGCATPVDVSPCTTNSAAGRIARLHEPLGRDRATPLGLDAHDLRARRGERIGHALAERPVHAAEDAVAWPDEVSTIVCIPPLPVALTGNAVVLVRIVARSSSATSSMTAPKAGSRCPMSAGPARRATRWGTGEGPEPSRRRSGTAAKDVTRGARPPARAARCLPP